MLKEKKPNITHKTLSGFAWSFFGTGSQALLRILFLMILSRLLNPDDFGTVSVALIIVGFLNMVSELGIGSAIVQINELKEGHISTGFSFSIIFGFILSVLLWIGAPLFSSFFRIEELSNILRALCFVIPINSLSVVAENLMVRNLEFKKLILRQLFSYVIGYGFVGIFLSLLNFGVWALVGATIGQAIVNTLVLLIIQPHPKKLFMNKKLLKELLFLGGGFTTASIGNYFATQADNFIIGRWLGTFELGLYTRSYQLMVMPATLIGQTLDKVLFPTLSRFQNDISKLKQAFLRSFFIVGFITLPLSVVSILLAPEIIYILLGSSWSGAVLPFQILAVGMFFRTSYKISDSLTRSLGAVYSRAWRQWVYTGLVVIGGLVGVKWGIEGVAFGVLLALSIHFIIMTSLSLQLIKISWIDIFKKISKPLVISFIFGLEILIIKRALFVYAFPNLIDLLIILCVLIITTGSLIFLPESITGNDIVWFKVTIRSYLIEKIKNLKQEKHLFNNEET